MTVARTVMQRAGAMLLLFMLMAAVWALLAAPLATLYAQQSQSVARAEEQLARYRTIVNRTQPLKAKIQALRQHLSNAGGYLGGDNDDRVGADLQEVIKEIVARSGGRLTRITALAPADEETARRIAVRADLVTGIAGLQKTFHALETATPYLFMDNLSIRARTVSNGASDSALQVRFDVAGYRRAAP